MGKTILVLGGVRSGKSRLAEGLAAGRPPVVYVATAGLDPSDPEMGERVARHRASRPESWRTEEIGYGLDSALPGLVESGGTVLVDSVTLWIASLLLGFGGEPLEGPAILERVEAVGQAAKRGNSDVVWVSDEVGLGGIAGDALARRFADVLGLANQALAEASDEVSLSVAGRPVRIK